MIDCKTWRTSETRGRPLKSDTTFDFGKVSLNEWLRAATFDRGVGIALFTLQVTHHIGPKVDDERDAVGTVLEQGGAHYLGNQSAHIQPDHWHRNGAGDRYVTDGQIKAFALTSGTC